MDLTEHILCGFGFKCVKIGEQMKMFLFMTQNVLLFVGTNFHGFGENCQIVDS